MRTHLRGRPYLQKPDERAVTQQRAQRHQVGNGHPRRKGNLLPAEMPEFPGGEVALEKYIIKHTNIPTQWKEEGPEEGKVYFSFVVDQDGIVRDVKVLSDKAGYGCGESNTGMFFSMPAWKPGRQNGHRVNVRMQLPVIFRR